MSSSLARCLFFTFAGVIIGGKLVDIWVEQAKKKDDEMVKKTERLVDLWIDGFKKVEEINKSSNKQSNSNLSNKQ